MRIISKTKLIIFSIAIISASFLFPYSGYASEWGLKAAEQQEILQTINTEQVRLDELSNQYTEAMIKQEQLETKLKETEKDIENTKKEIDNKQKQLKQQMITTYKNGEVSIINVLLDSSSFESFVNNMNFCSKYINMTDKLLKDKKILEKTLKEKQNTQKQELKELENAIQEIENSKTEADLTIKNLQAQYEQLDKEIAFLILQEQLTSNQSNSVENYDNYITEDVFNAFNDGNASTEIYQMEEIVQKIEAGESTAGYSNDIVSRAYAMLGSPYVWGGTTSDGFDCSGFVSYCLTGEQGTRLGTTETFSGWTQVDEPQPGDICVIHNDNSQHTGIYVGDGNMVHASTYGVGVIESPVQEGMTYVRYE